MSFINSGMLEQRRGLSHSPLAIRIVSPPPEQLENFRCLLSWLKMARIHSQNSSMESFRIIVDLSRHLPAVPQHYQHSNKLFHLIDKVQNVASTGLVEPDLPQMAVEVIGDLYNTYPFLNSIPLTPTPARETLSSPVDFSLQSNNACNLH